MPKDVLPHAELSTLANENQAADAPTPKIAASYDGGGKWMGRNLKSGTGSCIFKLEAYPPRWSYNDFTPLSRPYQTAEPILDTARG